jgi:RHS repeat-associated protein
MRAPWGLAAAFSILSCSGRLVGSRVARPYAIDRGSNQTGRVTTSGNGDSRILHQYDALGRVTAREYDLEGSSFVFVTTYGYPQGGTGPGSVVVAEEYPDHEFAQYGYDAGGARVSVTSGGQAIVKSVQRNARGQTTEVRFGDDTVTRHSYADASDLRLDALVTTSSSGTIQSYHYRYDPAGNVVAIDDDCDEGQTTVCGASSGPYSKSFAYDSLGQLTGMSTGAGSCRDGCRYAYDAAGNLVDHAGRSQVYPRPGQRRPHAPIASGGEVRDYDEDGNLVRAGGLVLRWNAESMAVGAAQDGQVVTEKSFVGEAVWKKIEGGQVIYYLPGARAEDGKLRKDFDGLAERAPDGTLRFYHGDHLRSSVLVTNERQEVVHRASYLPYGEEVSPAVGDFTPRYQFNFKETDRSGLYDYGARLYDPAAGRWVSADTSLADGLNRYAYVENNPVGRTDSTGHASEEVIERGPVKIYFDPEAHTIRIGANITFTGPGATQAYVDQAIQNINQTWSQRTSFGGATYTVRSEVTGERAETLPIDIPLHDFLESLATWRKGLTGAPLSVPKRDPDSIPFYVDTKKDFSMTSGYGWGWSELFAGDKRSMTPPHEFGHILGLPDEYRKNRGLGKVHTTPSLMGLGGLLPSAANYRSLVTGIGLMATPEQRDSGFATFKIGTLNFYHSVTPVPAPIRAELDPR